MAVSVATKLTKKELDLLKRLTKEYGFMSKSEAIRNAIRLYMNLLSLAPRERLRMLQIINELIAPSQRSSGELIEEVHSEDDRI